MSRNALEQPLLSLLPTLSSDTLPRQLVDLASSLLAQSRNNASTLKAEEEVARSYACSHIACERLKTSLDLPPINKRPPVQPRIYARLYGYLDRVLVGNGRTPQGARTPGGKSREAEGALGSASGSRLRTRERPTPSKDAVLAQFRTPSKSTSTDQPVRTSMKRKQPTPDVLPPWVRPTIRSMCTQLDSGQRIGRTVLAGMQTIVIPHGKRTTDQWVGTHLTSLLASVYFLVASQVVILQTEQEYDAKSYRKLRTQILNALQQARSGVVIKGKAEDQAWEGWSDIVARDIDVAVNKVAESSWKEEEWFTGIEDMIGLDNSTVGGLDEDTEMGGVDEELEAGRYEKVLVRRGDTMDQDRWIMTERKRQEYRSWKEEILRKADEIEKAREGAMDVDVAA